MAKLSLKPMVLRPGGAGSGAMNPFAQFGKGAAAKSSAAQTAFAYEEPKPKKPDSEIIRYSRDFLLQYSLKMMDAPANLDHNQSECVINKSDPTQAGASDALLNAIPAAEDQDDRNWRTRTALPPQEVQKERELLRGPSPQQDDKSSSAAQPQSKPQSKSASTPFGDAKATNNTASSGAAGAGSQASALQSAASVGKKAWMPGTTSKEGDSSSLKIVKGILNKLTPEKFDRLVGQLIEQVKSVDVLKGLIALIFQNAVEQPTFVAMYAELGQTLAEQLPELAPEKGETKPITFQKLLLDTCQDQFESASTARQELEKVSGPERQAEERKVKMRTIGTIRLIAELYKKSVVREPVVHACIKELLGAPGSIPTEESIEALCEMVTIAGKRLDETSKVKAKGMVNGYFAAMEKLSNSMKLAPRIRFLIRDVLDLRRMKWVPRRETLKAKKLTEIHAEAHAELGMMPAVAMAALPPLPGAQSHSVGRKAEDEVDLFPSFAGAENGGWEKMLAGITSSSSAGKESSSALLGDYAPVAQQPAEAPEAAEGSNATPPQTSAAPQYIKDLSQEDREKRADGMFSEFLSSSDIKEATFCTHELAAPGFLPVLVQRGVLKMLECTAVRDQNVISDILVELPSHGAAYSGNDLQAGIDLVTKEMEDLRMDYPLAPKLCGGVIGRALLAGLLPPSALVDLCKPIEAGETRRALMAPALQYVKEKQGEEKLKELTSGLKASSFLELDTELDPPDLPSVKDFLEAEKLTALSV